MRVATVADERQMAKVELMIANSTMIQALPQNCLPRMKAGSSVELANDETRLVPQPTMSPHAQKMKKTPMITTEYSSARGTLRRGFSVSSATGAEASHPVSESRPNVTP